MRAMANRIKNEIKGKLEIYKRKKNNFYQIIERDCAFLRENSLIDYSLLIGEIGTDQIQRVKEMVREDKSLGHGLYYSTDGKAYLIGIIDPLTKFTMRKEAEFQLKRIKHGETMSCVPPDLYAGRFSRAMKQYI